MATKKATQTKKATRMTTHQAEFARAVLGRQLVRSAFSQLTPGNDTELNGRLTSQLLDVIKSDRLSDTHSRTANYGNLGLLQGFEFSSKNPFTRYFTPAYKIHIHREDRQCTVQTEEFIPLDHFGAQQPHYFGLVSAVGTFDFDKHHHATCIQETGLLRTDKPAAVTLKLSIPGDRQRPFLVVLGLRIYTLVNGDAYVLSGGGSGSLVIAAAFPGKL